MGALPSESAPMHSETYETFEARAIPRMREKCPATYESLTLDAPRVRIAPHGAAPQAATLLPGVIPAGRDPRGRRTGLEDRRGTRGGALDPARARAPRQGRRARPVHRRAAQARGAAAARAALHLRRALVRKPAEGAHLRRDRRSAERQPEHDVPAAPAARGARADRGQLGAPGAALAALLLAHRRRPRRVRAARARRAPVSRLGGELDRHDRQGGLPPMPGARAATHVPLAPDEAYALWTDVSRWPTFIDGFARADRIDDAWPGEGAKLV